MIPGSRRPKTEAKTYLRQPAYELGGLGSTLCDQRHLEASAKSKVGTSYAIRRFAIRQRDVSREVAHLGRRG